tara:strand:+ start:859 stop:1053 length:195 start_codon:yes stop_codon:yes gene_type:complete
MDEETERIWELVKDWKLEYEVMYTAIAYMKSDPTMSVGEAIADSAMMWRYAIFDARHRSLVSPQ